MACVGPLKKSGSPKVTCRGARRDLLPDIFEHHLALHHAELALIHRHHRTMPAQVLAAAAGLGVGDRFGLAKLMETRVTASEIAAVGYQKLEPVKRDVADGLAAGELHQRWTIPCSRARTWLA